MLLSMCLSARLLLGGVLVATLLAACQKPPPVAETKPRRKSFEDSNAWRPSTAAAAPASASAGSSTDAQAAQVRQTWEQARQATNDAERQRLAGEALKQSQAMAEQPSGQQGPGHQ